MSAAFNNIPEVLRLAGTFGALPVFVGGALQYQLENLTNLNKKLEAVTEELLDSTRETQNLSKERDRLLEEQERLMAENIALRSLLEKARSAG